MSVTTNREYITKTLAQFNVDEDTIDLIMVDNADLESSATIDSVGCKKAIYKHMSNILPSVAQNVSEGGYSVSWNVDALKLWYNSLCNELGEDNVLSARPKIRNRSNMW